MTEKYVWKPVLALKPLRNNNITSKNIKKNKEISSTNQNDSKIYLVYHINIK